MEAPFSLGAFKPFPANASVLAPWYTPTLHSPDKCSLTLITGHDPVCEVWWSLRALLEQPSGSLRNHAAWMFMDMHSGSKQDVQECPANRHLCTPRLLTPSGKRNSSMLSTWASGDLPSPCYNVTLTPHSPSLLFSSPLTVQQLGLPTFWLMDLRLPLWHSWGATFCGFLILHWPSQVSQDLCFSISHYLVM